MKNLLLVLLIASFSLGIATAEEAFENPEARHEWLESTYQNKQVDMPANFGIRQQKLSNSLPNAAEGLSKSGSQVNSQTWMHAGPDNVGGRTRAVEYDRTNPNILIAGGVSGGIWRSVDGGQSWVQTTGIHEIPSVTTILQDPRPGNNNIWYCAGGEYDGNSASRCYSAIYTGNGIFKSTDNGLTWSPYGTTQDNQPQKLRMSERAYRLAIDPNKLDEDILYLACVGTILKISENGTKYEVALDIENLEYNNQATDIIITPSGKYYATLSFKSHYTDQTSHSGIFYSEDGDHWENISPDFLQPTHRIVMDYYRSNENLIYFLTSNIVEISTGCDTRSEECNSIFKLERNDDENTWTDLSASLPFFDAKHPYNSLLTFQDYRMDIKICPTDLSIVIIGGANCFISYDGFNSTNNTKWVAGYSPEYDENVMSDTTLTIQQIYVKVLNRMFPTGGWDFHWFTFNPENPLEVISGSDHGIHKMPDISENAPKDWIDINNGYCTTQFFDCAINKHKAGDDIILGGLQDNGTYGNYFSNTSFQKYWIGDGMETYITENNSILLSSQLNNIFRFDLYNGQAYSGSMINLGAEAEDGVQFNTQFAVNPYTEKEFVTATDNVIAVCTDFTILDAWKNYEYHHIDNLNTSCISYLSESINGVLIGTSNKNLYKVTDLSKDNFTYEVIDLPDFATGNYVSDVWTDPQDTDHFIAIVSNYLTLGMLETYDNGETWQDHGGNLEEFPDGSGAGHSFRCYEKLVYEGDTLHLLGTSDGLFSTHTLAGEKTIWVREGANTIGKAVIEDIEVRELDGRIVIATHGNGLFKTNYATSVDEFNGKNLGFAVSEVFPNPASTSINFVVNTDEVANINVKFMDLNGNEIATISNEELMDTKKINFDVSNLSQGTYFLHISSGSNYVTKKVNIVR